MQMEDVRPRFEGEIDEPTRAAIAFRNSPLITVHRIEMDYVRLHRLSHKRHLKHRAQCLKSPVAPEPSPPGTPPEIPNTEPENPANPGPDAPACLNPFLLGAAASSDQTPSPADPAIDASEPGPQGRKMGSRGCEPPKWKEETPFLAAAGRRGAAGGVPSEINHPEDAQLTDPVTPPESTSPPASGDRPDEPGAARTPNSGPVTTPPTFGAQNFFASRTNPGRQ